MRVFVRAVTAFAVVVSSAAFARPVSTTHPFRVSVTKLSPCTGEQTLVELDGRVVVERSGKPARYLVSTELHGSVTGQGGGTRFEVTGAESASFEAPGPAGELVVSTHARVISTATEAPVVGYDVETIRIDAAGDVGAVANDFEFTCD